MLIQCPECDLQVSDKAIACPHCGYPINSTAKQRKPRNKNNKRRRLPNGFGQISEIKNRNLRNPFRAMITIGKDEKGRPICKPLKPITYFKTYNDAYAALVEYNKNPYDLNSDITIKELYDKWSEEHFRTLSSKSSIAVIKSAWAYCSSLHNMKVRDVRIHHIKKCIEQGYYLHKNGNKHVPSSNMKHRMKSIFNMMFDYAIEYEIIDKNYSRMFDYTDNSMTENSNMQKHMPFTDAEIALLWENINDVNGIDLILIQCYSGWRPREMCLMKIANVDLQQWTFKGGMKTMSGTNRLVPIHSKIRSLVKKHFDRAVMLKSDYLFNYTDTQDGNYMITYYRYKKIFDTIKERLNLNPSHRPHDGRVHFVTTAKKFNVDDYAIKYIVGHAITDITEKIYTQRNIEWLQSEIEKIQ